MKLFGFTLFERTQTDPRIQEMLEATLAYQNVHALHQASKTVNWRGGGAHPIITLANRLPGMGLEHETMMKLAHVLRYLIPEVNLSFSLRRSIEGIPYIESDDDGLKTAIQEFLDNVPVGAAGDDGIVKGIDQFRSATATAADEYGQAFPEIIMNEAGTEIDRLFVPNSRDFSLRELSRPDPEHPGKRYEIVFNHKTKGKVPIDSPLIQRLAFRYDGNSDWPLPMVWGLSFVAQVLVHMADAVRKQWLHSGQPPSLITVEYGEKANITTKSEKDIFGNSIIGDENLISIKKSIDMVNQALFNGASGVNAYASVINGEVNLKPLYASPVTESVAPFIEQHYKMIAGQIISASDVPSYLFPAMKSDSTGLGSARDNIVAARAENAAVRRRHPQERIIRRVIDLWILLNTSRPSALGNYSIEWDSTSLIDEAQVQEAQVRKATAHAQFIENAFRLYGSGEDIIDDPNAPLNEQLTEEMIEYLERHGVIPASS